MQKMLWLELLQSGASGLLRRRRGLFMGFAGGGLIVFALLIWAGICVVGYFVQTGLDFYLLAVAVGMVMGGIQALSRATYAKFLPENTPDTASYFSFYDVMDKISTVAGTFVFGFVEQLTGGMRNSVATLAVFFLISLLVLSFVSVRRMRTASAPVL